MRPILYPPSETSFSNHGIGPVADAISCTVSEALNGEYELQLTLPTTSRHRAEIQDRTLVLARPNPYDRPQPFRIYREAKSSELTVAYYARHISYDADGCVIAPFTAQSAAQAVEKINEKHLTENPFSLTTSVEKTEEMSVKAPTVLRALLGESDDSLLVRYGGELRFDRFAIAHSPARGQNRGFEIAYGKNLIDLRQERNLADVYSGVLPYWSSGEIVVIGNVQFAPGGFPLSRVKPVDLTIEFDDQPSVEQLNAAGAAYVAREKIGKPKVSITTSFVPPGSIGLHTLEELELGDIVAVRVEKLGINVESRMIAYRWDVLKERYVSVEIGEKQETAAAAISDAKRLTRGKLDPARFGCGSIGGGAIKNGGVTREKLSVELHEQLEYQNDSIAALYQRDIELAENYALKSELLAYQTETTQSLALQQQRLTADAAAIESLASWKSSNENAVESIATIQQTVSEQGAEISLKASMADLNAANSKVAEIVAWTGMENGTLTSRILLDADTVAIRNRLTAVEGYFRFLSAGILRAEHVVSAPSLHADNSITIGAGAEGETYVPTMSHWHHIYVNDDGSVSFGSAYAASGEMPSFNVADTKKYRDGVSARTASSVSYDADENGDKIWDTINVRSADGHIEALSISPDAYTMGKTAGAREVTITRVTNGGRGDYAWGLDDQLYCSLTANAAASNGATGSGIFTFGVQDIYNYGVTQGRQGYTQGVFKEVSVTRQGSQFGYYPRGSAVTVTQQGARETYTVYYRDPISNVLTVVPWNLYRAGSTATYYQGGILSYAYYAGTTGTYYTKS